MQQECLDRLYHPQMEFYREIYKNSIRWNGIDSLENKTVLVYCEQGFGDIIQFIRYIPYLKKKGCRIGIQIPTELNDLLSTFEGVDFTVDKESTELPNHDYHVLSMSLPFVLGIIETDIPYIKTELRLDLDKKLNIGIAWEGNPTHSNTNERNCPLGVFRKIHDMENVQLYVLQKYIYNTKLIEGCEDFNLLSISLNSFLDTAKLINSVDLVVSVDTSVLHLAGAMGKKTIGLIGKQKDPRWSSGVNWYPNIKFIEQTSVGNWNSVATQLLTFVGMERTKWMANQQS